MLGIDLFLVQSPLKLDRLRVNKIFHVCTCKRGKGPKCSAFSSAGLPYGERVQPLCERGGVRAALLGERAGLHPAQLLHPVPEGPVLALPHRVVP